MLRDHADVQPSVLLTLHTISTFMDGEGFCFVGQARIAAGARTSVRSVRRHIADAEKKGWLSIKLQPVKGKKNLHLSFLNNYRACVPRQLDLADTDEMLRDAVVSSLGDVEGREDIAVSLPPVEAYEAEDNRSETCGQTGEEVRTNEWGGEDTAMAEELFSKNSSVITPQKEGALSRTRSLDKRIEEPKRKRGSGPVPIASFLPEFGATEPKAVLREMPPAKPAVVVDVEANRMAARRGLEEFGQRIAAK
jgi:hypothetical protein